METKNYNIRLKEILNELQNGIPINDRGINQLEKLVREADSIGQINGLIIFQNNTRQTIEKQLAPLLTNKDKPKKRTSLFGDVVRNFKQDLTDHLNLDASRG